MNPYAKGLGSEVYAQSAPTSAGKVATHFNSPYMKAITQNLMTAIYGSPQDELTRQRIEQSKLAMEQTKAQMAQAASEQQARDEFSMSLLSDDSLFDQETGGLTPKGRRVLTAQAIRSGQGIPDVWYDTGDYQGRVRLQQFDQDWRDLVREDTQAHELARDNTRHSQNIFMTGYEHELALEKAGVDNSYELGQMLAGHEYDKIMANINNTFEGEQNALDRAFDARTTALDYTTEMNTTPEQLGDVLTLLGINGGEDLTQGLSEATPYPTSSSTKSATLLPWDRMYEFAYIQLEGQGLSEKDRVAKASEIATQSLALHQQKGLSEMDATLQIMQMGNAPQSNSSNVITTPSGLTIEPLN